MSKCVWLVLGMGLVLGLVLVSRLSVVCMCGYCCLPSGSCIPLSLCRSGRCGWGGGIGQLGRMRGVHHAIRVVQRLRVLQLHQIVLLRRLVQRQLRECIIDGEPLALATDAPRILPLVQFLSHVHHEHLGAMHVVIVLNSGTQIKISLNHLELCVLTSNTPRQRPRSPTTPASSSTSRTAVTDDSSSGSTPPPGTIHNSGRRDEVTKSTWVQVNILLVTFWKNPMLFLWISKYFETCEARSIWTSNYINKLANCYLPPPHSPISRKYKQPGA